MITWKSQQPHEDDKKKKPILCVLLLTCTYLWLYLWQERSDEVFVLFIEPFHNVDQTLQSRLKESSTNTKIRSDSAANYNVHSHPISDSFYLSLCSWQSHPLSWGRGAFQSLKEDDFEHFKILQHKWLALISLSSAQLLQHAVRLLLHARLLGLKIRDIKWTRNIHVFQSFQLEKPDNAIKQCVRTVAVLPPNMALSAQRFLSWWPRLQRGPWQPQGPSWIVWAVEADRRMSVVISNLRQTSLRALSPHSCPTVWTQWSPCCRVCLWLFAGMCKPSEDDRFR